MSKWLDEDGYPTEEALDTIKNWNYQDVPGLIDFIRSLWKWPEYIEITEDKKLEISTCGWSGNESIIYALESNSIFWHMYWESSDRGGHYVFDLWNVRLEKKEMSDLEFLIKRYIFFYDNCNSPLICKEEKTNMKYVAKILNRIIKRKEPIDYPT